MANQLDELVHHDQTDDCPVCRAQNFVDLALIPAVAAWELNNELPRFSLALHGAAALLGVMLEEGVTREDVDAALSELLDDIERQIAETESENHLCAPITSAKRALRRSFCMSLKPGIRRESLRHQQKQDRKPRSTQAFN